MRSLYLGTLSMVLGLMLGFAGALGVFGLGEVIWAIAFGTALSPSGSSPQAVSPASPLQSLSQGER